MDKLNFLKNEFPLLATKLQADAKGSWGVLNAQQMVEHMSDSISFATGKNNQKLISPVEKVDVFKAFAMSDKEFKPNTPNSLMSETPAPAKHNTMQASIDELNTTISDFIHYFENNKGATLINPFFGELNFEEWTHLLYKHAVHHCKQFGLL
ncbi:MAG: DUF1569 domain-containing protein [Bacteroidetes bacterium]|nr:DUF1569 domain-containing protein [Bacteroidota bacterium]